jgi:two-component system cell cycle sensor histidine kinase/response regulator CckA
MPETTPAKPGILLIESQGVVARLAARPGLEGWEFTPVDRLASADRLLQSRSFHAVVLDLHLDDAEGLDAYRRARALAPGLPMIAFIEARDVRLAEAVVSEGAQACLPRESLSGPGAAAALDWALRQAVIRGAAEARRYRALFDSAPLGILLAAGRRVAMANPAALEALGYAEADLARMSVVDLFPSENRPAVERALDAAAAVGEIPEASFQAALRRSDGSQAHCRVFLKAALLNDSPAVSMYLAFTGEAPAGKGRGRSETMAALGRMAGGLAHDFNNLLTAINGYADHMMTLAGGDARLSHGISSIRKAGDAAAALARGLGEFGRVSLEKPVPSALQDVRVDAVIDREAPSLASMLGSGRELRIRPGAGFAAARLEAGQLEFLLGNLVKHARDAMPEGGKVTLATRIVEVTEGQAFTHLEAGAGPHVVIEVSDTGPGPDPRERDGLFEPFAGGEGRRGNSLALAAVYGIVRQAGGGISAGAVENGGRGGRISLFLPARRAVQPSGVEAPHAEAARLVAEAAHLLDGMDRDRRAGAAPAAPGNAHGTVLLVEDETSMREMMALVLQRYGYAVLETVSEAEAVKAAAAHPEADLVITDITLRGSYGHEMVERLRVLRPGLPALYISGHTLEYLGDQGIRLPPAAFLEKPFSPSQLALKVRETLGARKTST